MTLISTTDTDRLAAVADALVKQPDMVVLHRLTRAAGRRDWYLIERPEQLPDLLRWGRPGDSYTFFLKPQLRIRGRVDDDFAARARAALAEVPDHTDEILVGRLHPGRPLLADVEGICGPEADDLTTWLYEHWGEPAVAGRHPPLLSEDPEELINAYVPDERGQVRPGVY